MIRSLEIFCGAGITGLTSHIDSGDVLDVASSMGGKETILALWERPTIKMCEALLKENGQEFRELIQDMYKSDMEGAS